MDTGHPECPIGQVAVGSNHRSSPHSGDWHRVLPLPSNHRQTEERSKTARRKISCGNGGPWKASKNKPRFSTLSTALGNPATPAGFPHSHSFDDCSFI